MKTLTTIAPECVECGKPCKVYISRSVVLRRITEFSECCKARVRRFQEGESGQAVIEYALILGGVALVLIISVLLVLDVGLWETTHPEACYTQESSSIRIEP